MTCSAVDGFGFLLMEVDSTLTAIQWALTYLGTVRFMTPKPCVVLDIDGTVLLNKADGGARCVLAFTDLARACSAAGIRIFCVTAREDTPSNRRHTERQLAGCGISPVERLYMRPPDGIYAVYKRDARREISANGYGILLSVGDQIADLTYGSLGDLPDDRTFVGQLGDDRGFAIKLPSEFT